MHVGVRIDVAARAFAGSGAEVEHPRRIDGARCGERTEDAEEPDALRVFA
jgi:hypothetical protein